MSDMGRELSVADAAALAATGVGALSDPYADREYRTAMAAVMAEQAVRTAMERGA